MKFLAGVERDLEKAGIGVGASAQPRYWFSTGNYVLNKIISGSFNKGIPQGRLTCFAGPAASGKSFLAANAMREAQKEGAYIVTIDSENALDDDFVRAIGVDVTSNYSYISVDTMSQTKKTVSAIVNGFTNEYGDDPEAPKVLIVIDSLDMLLTDTEAEQFSKGISKGDQGQRNKQLKAMLKSFVQAVKRPNVSMIVTAQVYKNQDVMNGEGNWIVADAIKYSLSQITLLTKLKLRAEAGSRIIDGIRMKCESYKTRFTKPFQTVTIELPYDEGMDPYNGLLEVAKDMGVVIQKGSRYTIAGEEQSWYSKEFGERTEQVLQMCDDATKVFLSTSVSDDELDLSKNPSSKSQRKARAEKED